MQRFLGPRRLRVAGVIVVAIAAVVSVAAIGGAASSSAAESEPLCVQHPALCAESNNAWSYEGTTYTSGHDEPSLLFYSNQAGSGNSSEYHLTLPSDPPAPPTAGGGGTTWNFQLRPAFWFGMAMCDDQSAPNPGVTCPPDSDSNIHTGTDPTKPDYCKPLGVMEIGTTSINAIVDVQGALRLEVMRYAGRTAGVPLTLVRRPVKTYRGAPTIHYPCDIRFDAFEVQRWAAIPLNEIFLSEPQREKLKQLAEKPLGLTVESVAGLLPAHLVPEETRRELLRGPEKAKAVSGTTESGEPEQPLSVAAGSQAGPSDGDAFLVQAEMDEQKVLAGGSVHNGRLVGATRDAALARLQGAVAAMNAETGTEVKKLSELRTMHVAWLKERLRSLPPLEVQS